MKWFMSRAAMDRHRKAISTKRSISPASTNSRSFLSSRTTDGRFRFPSASRQRAARSPKWRAAMKGLLSLRSMAAIMKRPRALLHKLWRKPAQARAPAWSSRKCPASAPHSSSDDPKKYKNEAVLAEEKSAIRLPVLKQWLHRTRTAYRRRIRSAATAAFRAD